MSSWKYFVKLHRDDNVITVTKKTPAKTVIHVNSDPITTRQVIPLGHKVAIEDIEEGGPIIKYGVEIGIASSRIEKGEHVHIHNVAEVSLEIRDRVKKQSLGGL